MQITGQQDNNLSKHSPELRTIKFYSTLLLDCFFSFRYYHVSDVHKQRREKNQWRGKSKRFREKTMRITGSKYVIEQVKKTNQKKQIDTKKCLNQIKSPQVFLISVMLRKKKNWFNNLIYLHLIFFCYLYFPKYEQYLEYYLVFRKEH